MKIFVPRERAEGERRVGLSPDVVEKLVGTGHSVEIEAGAGAAAGFPDDAYAAAGAGIRGDGSDADVIVRVAAPSADEAGRLRPGVAVIGFLAPLSDRAGIERLRERGVHGLAMEAIPRTTRAQSMDALSSQATVAGYKAAVIAADRVHKLFPLLMTAAGTIAPARALVLGAGVAGLQAIATVRRLGAVVSAFDVRPAVAEQVESLGASFLDLGVKGEETAGGYAKELTPEQQAAQQQALAERIPEFDVVITTALVPGRPAPRLIPAGAVERMRAGSCIVDLAAETGGNCELTRPGEQIEAHGVTIVGYTNLPSLMANDATRLYARNVLALLQLLAPEGELVLDFDDDIIAAACVTRTREEAA